jgi:hypothetical protein
MQAAAAQCSAEVLAEFEQHTTSEYHYDQDEVWRQATLGERHHYRSPLYARDFPSIKIWLMLSKYPLMAGRRVPEPQPLLAHGRLSRNSGRPSGTTQRTRLLVHTSSRGGTTLGSSRLQVVTSISSGNSVFSKVTWVPQRGQNDRVPFSLDLNRAGLPLTKRNSPRRTLNHVTNGAPIVRRQIEQWQLLL